MGQHIIVGVLLIVIGFLVMRFSAIMLKSFGRIGSFDKYLKTEGGTRLFYQLFGLLLIVAGFLVATGALQRSLRSLFRPFFPG